LLPGCLSRTPTSLVDDECDAVKDKELLQSKGQTKETKEEETNERADGWAMGAAVNPGKCLDVPGGSVWNGQKLSVWDCNGQAPQAWQWWGDGTMRYAANTKFCIDIEAFQCPDGPEKGNWRCFTAGSNVEIYECHGGINQQFLFQGTELAIPASLVVTSAESSKSPATTYCVADKTGKYENSAALTVQPCSETYRLTAPALLGSQLRPLAVIGTEKQVCMDASNNKVVNGQPMLVWECLKEAGGFLQSNQVFSYNEQDSTIRFVRFPNMCLDANGDQFSEGGSIQAWSCHGKDNQQWSLEDHQIKVKSKALCIGDPAKSFAKGNWMKLTTCSPWQGINFRGIDSMDCPWKKTNSKLWDPTCGDGTTGSGYECVHQGHGQRLMCPQKLPNMCSSQVCGKNKDFCCSKNDCSNHGGDRPC